MRSKLSAPAALGIAALVAFTIFITWRAMKLESSVFERARTPALVNKGAPEFSLSSLDGRTISLADYHGKKKLWVLLVYPMVRYAVYGAIAMVLVTLLHPVMAFGMVMLMGALALMVVPTSLASGTFPGWLRESIYVILPSTSLLSEDRFLSITQSSLKPVSWLEHATTLAYGLDYALACLLLAMWSFHYRSLKRD